MNTQRPISITFISWVFIIVSILSLALVTYTMADPETSEIFKELMSATDNIGLFSAPPWLEIMLSYLLSFVFIAAGILMLQGQRLGRNITIIVILGSLIFSFLSTGVFALILIKMPITLLIVFILFSNKANQYFK